MIRTLVVLLFHSKVDQVMFRLLAVWLEIDKLIVLVNELLCINYLAVIAIRVL